MARLWTSGAEWNDAAADQVTIVSGTPTITTTSPRTGTYAFRNTGAGGYKFAFTGATGTTYYARMYVNLDSLPTSGNTENLCGYNDGTFAIGFIRVTSTGALQLISKSSTQVGSDSPAITTGSYFLLEVAINIASGSGADDYVEARLNGISFASTTTATIGTVAPVDFRFVSMNGGVGVTGMTMDDLGLNDSSGSQQNSWPGIGSVILLKPTADSTVGTGWTNDQAATTNLFNSVDNTPPIGIADTTSGGGTHQIRNATSNANVNYDATMTTYSAAGITANDIINLVLPVINTSAPVSTSAKQGTVGVASNPTITNIALGALGTSGAFWGGTAAGTYPTGWAKWSFGTITYNPAVTVGTAPVMRVTQVTSSTRIAMVDAMGIYVDYTPAMPRRQLVRSDAQHRASYW